VPSRQGTATLLSAAAAHLAFLRSVRRLLVKSNVILSSPILVTLMMEALSFSETSVLTRATRLTSQMTAVKTSNLTYH
jgi:hypothetical protein